jgi:hypothetical protein
VAGDLEAEARAFLFPARLYSLGEVLERPCPVPALAGVYGWWFGRLPAEIDISGCHQYEGQTLLYTGISPRRPPANGRPPSRQTMRSRIRTHHTSNAEGSTLRKTLGCLLADELGIQLQRVGSGTRLTFLAGERVLSDWMHANARVSWLARRRGSSRIT